MSRFAGVRRVATNFYHILTGKQLRANTKQWIQTKSPFEVRRLVPLGPEVPLYVHFANGNDYTGRKEPSVVVNGALQAQTTQIDSAVLKETKDAVDNFLSENSVLARKINNYNNTKFKWLRNSIIALAGSVIGALAYPFWGLTNLPSILPMTLPKWAGFVIAGAEWFGALMLGFYVLFGLTRKLPKRIGIAVNTYFSNNEKANIRNLCKDTSKKEALAYVLSDLSKDKKNGEVRSVLRALEKEDAAKVNTAMKSFETSEEEPAQAAPPSPPTHPLAYTPPPPQPAFPVPAAPRPVRRADARVAKPVDGILRTKDDTPPHAQVVAPTQEAAQATPDTVIEPLPKGAQVAPAPPPEKPKEPDRQELALSKFIEAKKPSRDDYYNAAKVVRMWKPSTEEQKQLLEEAKKKVLAHDPAFLLGKRFDDYEILYRLGKGSMGMLYLVRPIDGDDKDEMQVVKFPGLNILREKVEIERAYKENRKDKDLQKQMQIYNGLMRRFYNEAQIIHSREIDHPNIISVLNMGTAFNLEIEGSPKEIPYYTTEFIKGRTLRWLSQQKLDADEFIEVVRKVFIPITDALKHMHTHKNKETGKEEPFIHRDIKPSNIMIELTPTPDGKIKIKRAVLLDFGTLRPAGGTETMSDQRLGTWKYMDKEYAMKGTEALTPKSDLLSWALTMVETIVGKLPWDQTLDQPESLKKVKEFEHKMPPEFEEIYERMYKKGYDYHDDIINAFHAWLAKQEELPPEERAVTKEKPVKTEEPATPVLGEAEGADTEPAGGLEADDLFGDLTIAPGSVEDAQKLIQEIGSELDKNPAPKRLLQINEQLAEIQKTFPGEEEIEGKLAEMMIRVSELLEGED